MTDAEMEAAINDLNAALIKKLGHEPYTKPVLKLHSNGLWSIHYYLDLDLRVESKWVSTPAAAFHEINRTIDKMPDGDMRGLSYFHQRADELIDFGRKMNIDPRFLDPIADTSDAIADALSSSSALQSQTEA